MYKRQGNVRELKNIVQRSALLSDDDSISIEHLPKNLVGLNEIETHSSNLSSNEKEHITKLLNQFGNQPKTIADNLEISVRTLYRKLQKHQLNVKDYSSTK